MEVKVIVNEKEMLFVDRSVEAVIQQLKRELNRANARNAELAKQVKQLKSDELSLSKTNERILDERDAAIAERNAATTRSNVNYNKIVALKIEFERVKETLMLKESLIKDMGSLARENYKRFLEEEEKANELKTRVSSYLAYINTIEGERNKAKDEAVALRKKVNETQKACDEYYDKLINTNNELNDAIREIGKLKIMIMDGTKYQGDLNDEITRLKSKVRDYEERIGSVSDDTTGSVNGNQD